MPRISQFYGIILMYHHEHAPPHIHAWYAEDKAEYASANSTRIAGKLPRRAEALALG